LAIKGKEAARKDIKELIGDFADTNARKNNF
jgi:hypothetical protein